MVRKVEVVLLDDLTGDPAQHTVVFGVEGTWFELHLTAANANEVTSALVRWSTAGATDRRAGRR